MIATKAVLVAAASSLLLVEAKPVGNIFKSIFKREIAMRGTNDLWARGKHFWPLKHHFLTTDKSRICVDAATDITTAFPKCEAALDKLPQSQKPSYITQTGSVEFEKVPSECTTEVAALGSKQIEGTSFANQGNNIIVSHPNPQVLQVFEQHFGSEDKSVGKSTT